MMRDVNQIQILADMIATNPDIMDHEIEWKGMKMTELKSIPLNSNPFLHDMYNCGIEITKDITVMYSTSGKYLILVFTNTGKRIHISFDESLTG
jgi:hypothetical protein